MSVIKIKVFQINQDRDPLRIKFCGLQETRDIQRSKGLLATLNPAIYDEVFSGDMDCHSLEGVYTKFNTDHPPFHRGHSLSVSDIVEVIEAPELVGRIKFFDEAGKFTGEVDYVDSDKYNSDIYEAHEANREILAVRLAGHHVPSVEPGFYFCDSFGFEKIGFAAGMTKKPDDLLRVVAKEPGKPAYEAGVADNLRAFQQAVRGYIETFPFDNDAVIICNEEGKINDMEPNCVINGELLVGPVFIIGSGDDGEFRSLTDGQAKEYLDMFRQAEMTAAEEPEQDGGMRMT